MTLEKIKSDLREGHMGWLLSLSFMRTIGIHGSSFAEQKTQHEAKTERNANRLERVVANVNFALSLPTL
jgi:hypothetical protein